jgi:hypothetical protein
MSSPWKTARDAFESRHTPILEYVNNQLPTDLNMLKNATADYISKGGVTEDPTKDVAYTNITAAYSRINSHKQTYHALNTDMAKSIKQISTAGDMGRLLAENGSLQQQIIQLEKDAKLSDQDVKSAELRDELLRSHPSNVTKQQLFLLGRPLRPTSIPYLWALSILFIGGSLILFQQISPPIAQPIAEWMSMPSDWSMFLSDGRIWGLLSGALVIVVIFLSLRIANVI